MSANPPETPEAAAWELFREIRREEEKAGQQQGGNQPVRTRLLALYAECLATTTGRVKEWRETLH